MSTYKTGNPLGSAAIKDLYDNAENLDFALNSLTALIWTDRLGKVRPSFFGMETSFLSQMTSQEGRFTSQLADQDVRFDTFIASSGYDIVGDYKVGSIPGGNPLTITEYNQLIRYNNELYKLTAATDIPFTASGKTDETWTATDSSHFVSVGDAALRQNLGSSEGFSLIGQATYSQMRNFTGSGNSVMCCGYDSTSTAGHGIFDYVPGDATTEDDDCVHIRDGLGRLWKRRFEGNKIRMAWAGGKSLYQSSEPQDAAFKKCLKAAASLSESGYPQSVIVGIDFGVTYLAERHYIRCGTFPESMAWKLPPEGGGCRFGIHGLFAIAEGAGFFVVQANNPDFNFQVDNAGIDFNVDNYTDIEIAVLVQSNYILRLESMVNAPDIRIHAGNYPGTVIYSSGKKDYSAVTAQWPDLNKVLPSIQNVGDVVLNVKSCGRDFYLTNTGAGMGHWGSVWTQNNRTWGYISNCYDLTMTYENYVPHNENSGGLVFSECGTMSLNNVLIGAGGIGNLCVWDCRNFHINRHIAICGNTTWAASNQVDDLNALEACNSEVNISGGHAQNSGRFMRIGFNSRVTFQHFTCWYVSEFILATNDLSKLRYRGQRKDVVGDPVKVFVKSGFLQQLNTSAQGWACKPPVVFDETIGAGWELELNAECNDIHSGYDSEPEENLAIVDIRTAAYGSFSSSEEFKPEGNTTNYVIRLANKQQLNKMRTRKTNFSRIRYTDDGSQSSFAMREAAHPLNGTVVGNGSTYQYPYRRPGKYFVSLTIPSSGGSCSVTKNGLTIFQTNVPGIHGILVDLKFQEQVLITTTGGSGTTLTGAQWRYTLEE